MFTRTSTIDACAAADRLGDGSVLVIDVRQQAEWNEGHIRGAIHIPVAQLPHRLHQLPSGTTIVTVCRSGHRSAVAARTLTRAGRDVLNLRGGLNAWTRAGLPLESARDRAR